MVVFEFPAGSLTFSRVNNKRSRITNFTIFRVALLTNAYNMLDNESLRYCTFDRVCENYELKI